MLTVKTHTFRAGAVLPVFKTAGAAGADIRAFLKDIEKDHPIWNYIQIDAEGPFILIPGNDRVLIPTGLAFEVPIAVVVLARIGVVTIDQLKSFRGYFIVLAFVVAAVVTPPDVVSQLALAIPMCLLYEVGIWAAKIFIKHTKAPDDEAESTEVAKP